MIPEVQLAYNAFCEAGFIRWQNIVLKDGGMQLPVRSVMTAASA